MFDPKEKKQLASYIRETSGIPDTESDDHVMAYALENSSDPELKKQIQVFKPMQTGTGGLSQSPSVLGNMWNETKDNLGKVANVDYWKKTGQQAVTDMKGIYTAGAENLKPQMPADVLQMILNPAMYAAGKTFAPAAKSMVSSLPEQVKNAKDIGMGAFGMGTPEQKQKASDFSQKYTSNLPETFQKEPVATTIKAASMALPLAKAGGELVGAVEGGVGKMAFPSGAPKTPGVKPPLPLEQQIVEQFKTRPINIPIKNRIANYFKPMDYAERTKGRWLARTQQTNENWPKAVNAIKEARPYDTINSIDWANEFNATAGMYPQWETMVKSNPVLKAIVDNPTMAKELTLDETQSVINHLNKYLSPTAKQGFPTPQELPLLQSVKKMKLNVMNTIPEMKTVASQYAKDMAVEDQLYKFFKDAPSTERGLRIGFNAGDTQSVKKMLDSYFGKDVVKEMGGYEKMYKTMKGLKSDWWKYLAATGALGAGAAYVAGK